MRQGAVNAFTGLVVSVRMTSAVCAVLRNIGQGTVNACTELVFSVQTIRAVCAEFKNIGHGTAIVCIELRNIKHRTGNSVQMGRVASAG